MTEHDILDELLVREGGWRDAQPRDNAPPDPPTNMGITLPTLQAYYRKHLGIPLSTPVTIEDLKKLTPVLARAIYTQMFIADPGFTAENVPYAPLRVQLIDFGVNSGPERAIRWLQRVLGRPTTGQLDAGTLRHLSDLHSDRVLIPWEGTRSQLALVNDALVAARSYMIDQSVDQGTMRKQDEEGVESRALSFFLAKP